MGCPPRQIELQTPKARVLLLGYPWLLVPAGQNGLACSDDQHPLSCAIVIAGVLGMVRIDQDCTRPSPSIFLALTDECQDVIRPRTLTIGDASDPEMTSSLGIECSI